MHWESLHRSFPVGRRAPHPDDRHRSTQFKATELLRAELAKIKDHSRVSLHGIGDGGRQWKFVFRIVDLMQQGENNASRVDAFHRFTRKLTGFYFGNRVPQPP